MKYIYITLVACFLSIPLYAQRYINERAFVHLDKDCYIAGEDIQAKFYLVDNSFGASDLSRVGYIEICDTERPYMQYKVSLDRGRGSIQMQIPQSVPTGIYQLSAYTRYMRNETADVFFKREIAIVNMTQNTKSERIELTSDPDKTIVLPIRNNTVKVFVDKPKYSNRESVKLSIENLPADVSDLVISVVRDDSITYIAPLDDNKWREQVAKTSPISSSRDWVAEYEGHIINGQIVPSTPQQRDNYGDFVSSVGFAGKDIRVLFGKINPDNGKVHYFTQDIYGKQDIVTSVLENNNSSQDFRVDITSPFADVLPTSLSRLNMIPENPKLMDRFVGMQLNRIITVDSIDYHIPFENLYGFKPAYTYDLDQYTRFSTVRQTIIEYILQLVVRKVGEESRIKVFFEKEKRFNAGNTLVILDGIPLYNHDYIFNYNPYLIKRVNIYDGRYVYGGEIHDCMACFETYKSDLPSIQLGNESQLFVYDCPEPPTPFIMPHYTDEATRKSLRPDFRHTLYWEPFGEYKVNSKDRLTFYTSDLTGTFKVTVEGFTKDGNSIYGYTQFIVNE